MVVWVRKRERGGSARGCAGVAIGVHLRRLAARKNPSPGPHCAHTRMVPDPRHPPVAPGGPWVGPAPLS